jgi:hypothetical protein
LGLFRLRQGFGETSWVCFDQVSILHFSLQFIITLAVINIFGFLEIGFVLHNRSILIERSSLLIVRGSLLIVHYHERFTFQKSISLPQLGEDARLMRKLCLFGGCGFG